MTEMTEMTHFIKSWPGKEHMFYPRRPIVNLSHLCHVGHGSCEELSEISHLLHDGYSNCAMSVTASPLPTDRSAFRWSNSALDHPQSHLWGAKPPATLRN
jgi:hypothetical protein